MDHVAALPVSDEATTPKPMQQVRDCLVAVMDKARTRPIETGDDSQRRLAFSGDNGTIAVYDLRAVASGTQVTAHRRKMIADYYNQARACYTAVNKDDPTM